MSHLIFILIIISLNVSAVNAATAIIQTETHFGTPCINTHGYWMPQDKYNPNIDSDEEFVSPPTLDEYKASIASFCKGNEVDELINFYQKWQADRSHSELLKFIILPELVLNATPYASCVEENNATKLAILLSAASGNTEGRVLALDILTSLTSGDSVAQKLEAFKLSLHTSLSQIDLKQLNASDLLGLSTLSIVGLSEEVITDRVKLWETHKHQLEQNSNARTLLRIADRYLLRNQREEALRYFTLAADKSSIRAVITMASLIANREAASENRFPEIQQLLKKYEGRLEGYEHLLPAYYYQYGSLGLVQQNLLTANQKYKAAISQNCREAAFEYGEFLTAMLNTCSDDDEEEEGRRREFHKQAIIAYEKAGDLGLELGYSKAVELLSNQDRPDHTAEQVRIKNKLLRSKIFFQSLDEIIESCGSDVDETSSKDKKASRAEMTDGIDRQGFMSTLLRGFLDVGGA